MELFDSLPLVCIVNDLYFCVHSGISPELRDLVDINTKINRF
jgi:serine/threonine-protein phosphatase 2B catalytic subunit